jgi:hypothetical protein
VPKAGPLWWVLSNKLRVTLGLRVPFEQYVDYSRVHRDGQVARRMFHLDQPAKRKAQTKDDPHYTPLGEYHNR